MCKWVGNSDEENYGEGKFTRVKQQFRRSNNSADNKQRLSYAGEK